MSTLDPNDDLSKRPFRCYYCGAGTLASPVFPQLPDLSRRPDKSRIQPSCCLPCTQDGKAIVSSPVRELPIATFNIALGEVALGLVSGRWLADA